VREREREREGEGERERESKAVINNILHLHVSSSH